MAEDISEAEHLLEKLKYGEILQFVRDEKLDIKGNKEKLVAAISKAVSEETIRAFFRAVRGIKVDISEHELVPKHEIMTAKEVAALLKEHHCKLADLPKIYDTDPISLKIGAKGGDAVRIKRKSPTAGQAYHYRLVIKSI